MKIFRTVLWGSLFIFPFFLFASQSGFLEDSLFSSISDDDEPELYQQLKIDKVDPNQSMTENNETPLHYAAYLGKFWAVRMLLEAGAKPNLLNQKKYSALHLAAQGGFENVTKALLTAGGDPCLLNDDGFMPIHLAASFGKLGVVDLLAKACKNNVDIQGVDGVTPLDLASQNGFNDVVLFLLSQGADPNSSARNSRGHPLQFAVHGGHPDIIQILLNHGAQVNATNDTGDTPFTWNGYIGNIQTAKILLSAGADPHITTTRFQYNALHTASIRGNTPLVQYLLQKHIYTGKEKSGAGAIALHYASLYGHLSTVKILFQIVGGLSEQDIYGNTPLHYAVSNARKDVACFLLSVGANPEIQNRGGEKPIDIIPSNDKQAWEDIFKNRSC